MTAFADEVETALAADLEALVGKGVFRDGDFEAVERAARVAALQAANRLVAHHINADHSDMQDTRLACDHGHDARYAGRRSRTVTTVLGPMTLERAWYHCETCNAGFAPRDRDLGIEAGPLSPGVLRMVGYAAGEYSFAISSKMIHELAALRVDAKTVERHAEALGREVAADERNVVEPEPMAARTAYAGLDGTGIPVRKSETEGRQGKQGGPAKTREVKLVSVWSAERLDPRTGRPVRDPGSASHSAAIESIASRDTDPEASRFARRVLRELERRGFDRAERQVIIGDGAAWIWNFAGEHLPRAIQIVDIFHARQNLFDIAKTIYGPGTDMATAWGKRLCDELDRPGGVDSVIAGIERNPAGQKAAAYFRNNRERMRYAEFRNQGLCVSSGVVEGACKSVIGKRLKQGGMHWTVDGANAIIALRCNFANNRFDDFWERRAARRAA